MSYHSFRVLLYINWLFFSKKKTRVIAISVLLIDALPTFSLEFSRQKSTLSGFTALCLLFSSSMTQKKQKLEVLIRRIFRVCLKSEIVSSLTFLSLIYVKRLISNRAMTVITSGFYRRLLSHAPALFLERLTAKKKVYEKMAWSIFCFF